MITPRLTFPLSPTTPAAPSHPSQPRPPPAPLHSRTRAKTPRVPRPPRARRFHPRITHHAPRPPASNTRPPAAPRPRSSFQVRHHGAPRFIWSRRAACQRRHTFGERGGRGGEDSKGEHCGRRREKTDALTPFPLLPQSPPPSPSRPGPASPPAACTPCRGPTTWPPSPRSPWGGRTPRPPCWAGCGGLATAWASWCWGWPWCCSR